jgi:hypothetical protein
MAQDWYYSQNGQRHGPVTGADLKQLAVSGKLQPTDHVWKEGMDRWAAARSVKGLFPAGDAPVVTMAPPPPLPARKSPPPAEVLEVADAEPAHPMAERPARADGLLGRAAGFWRRSNTRTRAGIIAGAGAVLVLLVLVPVLLLTGGKSSSGGGSPPSNDEPATDISQLVADYQADQKSADAKYKGRVKKYSGVMAVYEGRRDEGALVILRATVTDRVPAVYAYFTEESRKQVSKMKPGATLAFRGRCEGIVTATGTFLKLTDCVLDGPAPPPDEPSKGGSGDQKLTRLAFMNTLLKKSGIAQEKSVEAFGPVADGKGRRYILNALGGRFDHQWWVETFGDFKMKEFFDPFDNKLLKPEGGTFREGIWTYQCQDGPLSFLGQVVEADRSPTNRRIIVLYKVGLFEP